MKKISLLLPFIISGCANYIDNNVYILEKLPEYEIPVCVDYTVKEKTAGPVDIGGIDRYKLDNLSEFKKNLEINKIVPYTYCLNKLPKQVHLVEKKENDMTICYDRNNKVKLPILYCQKDMNVSVEINQRFVFR